MRCEGDDEAEEEAEGDGTGAVAEEGRRYAGRYDMIPAIRRRDPDHQHA